MRALIAALVLAWPVLAEEPMTPDEFLDMAEGNTLTFVIPGSGDIVGVERFLGRDRSVWTQPTGRCTYGEVQVRGEKLCFLYDDDPPGVIHCWHTFREDGAAHVRALENGEIQRIDRITRDYVGCDGEPIS